MRKLEQILKAVNEVTGFTKELLFEKNRSWDCVRGVFYLIACEEGYTHGKIAKYAHRSRTAICLVISHYKGYLDVGDKQIEELYNDIKNELNKLKEDDR